MQVIFRNTSQQRGITFIEVLIGLFIIVTGILGAVAMQATAKQASFDAMQRSVASSLTQDIIARMRANDPLNLAAYVDDYGGANNHPEPVNRCLSNTTFCTVNEMVANDQYEWELALRGGDVTSKKGLNVGGLVDATACISQNGNSIQVVISWQGREEMSDAEKATDCGTPGDKRRQVVATAFII